MKKVAAIWVALALMLGGCASEGGNSGSPSTSQSMSVPTAESEASTQAASKPGVGDTVPLTDDTTKEDVLLVAVQPTTKATDGSKPEAGNRYFAAKFTITNTGDQPLADGPFVTGSVTDSEGQEFQVADAVMSISAGPLLPGTVDAAAGQKRTGWLVYEVPANAKITGVQYQIGGLGDKAQFTI